MNDLTTANLILCILMNIALIINIVKSDILFKKLDLNQLQHFQSLESHQKQYIVKNCIDDLILGVVLRGVVVWLIVVLAYECLAHYGASGFPLLLFTLFYFLSGSYFIVRVFVYKKILNEQYRWFSAKLLKTQQKELEKEFE